MGLGRSKPLSSSTPVRILAKKINRRDGLRPETIALYAVQNLIPLLPEEVRLPRQKPVCPSEQIA